MVLMIAGLSIVNRLALSEEGHSFSLMEIDTGTVFWTLIIFAVLLLVLGKIAWKPILRVVGERETRIRGALEKADRVQKEAEQALASQKELFERQRKEAIGFLAKAKDEAKRAGEDILEKARRDAAEYTEQSRRQIEEERNRAIDAVRAYAVELALEAAGHLLGKTLDKETHQVIIREHIKEIAENLGKHQ